jgi:hypothetical protein
VIAHAFTRGKWMLMGDKDCLSISLPDRLPVRIALLHISRG